MNIRLFLVLVFLVFPSLANASVGYFNVRMVIGSVDSIFHVLERVKKIERYSEGVLSLESESLGDLERKNLKSFGSVVVCSNRLAEYGVGMMGTNPAKKSCGWCFHAIEFESREILLDEFSRGGGFVYQERVSM